VPTIPFFGWIANAAAYLTGSQGAVTQQARQTGCSRQCAYDHAEKVLAAVEARHGGGPTPEELIRQNEALRRENAQLWDWLTQTIEFPLARQQQFAVTALAMGLSLNQILALLAILLGARAAPSRSTVQPGTGAEEAVTTAITAPWRNSSALCPSSLRRMSRKDCHRPGPRRGGTTWPGCRR